MHFTTWLFNGATRTTLINIVDVNLNSVKVSTFKLNLHNLFKLSLHLHIT